MMKKIRILMMLALALCFVMFALASCGEPVDETPNAGDHTHTFADATCTAAKTCTTCGETEGEALGHTPVVDEAVAPTCTADGKTEGKHCSVCNEVIVAQQTVTTEGHKYVSTVTPPTCTADGYTTYECECGDSYVDDPVKTEGHKYVPTVTPPTCTADGYTTYECECGDSYVADPVKTEGHKYVETDNTATCTEAGTATFTCHCGDSYTDEIEKLGHVDEDLDVECDREGCTSKTAPKADSVISTFTANCVGSKVSVDRAYYVIGTIVEVLDAKNGIFLIDDGTGEKFYFRLPKNADGISHANWAIKIVVGDKVQIYGKINKYTTNTAPNGQYWPAMQSPVATVLEQHPHDFTFMPAGCSDPAYCACGQSFGEPLGCADADGDDLCDDCGKNVKFGYEYVEIRTDNGSGVIDEAAGTYTWGNNNFDVQVAKNTSSQLYKISKDHMRLYKGNNLVLTNKNGLKVVTITVYLTNSTQIAYFEKFLTGYEYTIDNENFSFTISVENFETITLTNPSNGSTTQIKGVEFGYEK